MLVACNVILPFQSVSAGISPSAGINSSLVAMVRVGGVNGQNSYAAL